MREIQWNDFPCAGMKVRFITKEDKNKIHIGKYDFNSTCNRRFFDENNKEYSSNDILLWEEIND